jgi:hypothetical protein
MISRLIQRGMMKAPLRMGIRITTEENMETFPLSAPTDGID